jgi:flavodoxin
LCPRGNREAPRKEKEEMNVLNMYFSSTGNTEKVALKIGETIQALGHKLDTLEVTTKDVEVDVLNYDYVFVGSGVYAWLPGKALIDLFEKLRKRYVQDGKLKLASPRRHSAKAVVYCTYGGAHTGINEAIPAVKYMGQLFDHLIGGYIPESFREHSTGGRLGDIRGRPNEDDLREVAERVTGVFRV